MFITSTSTACSGTNPINVHHKQFLKSFQNKTNQSSPQTVPETKLFRKKTNQCSPQTDFEIVLELNQSMFATNRFRNCSDQSMFITSTSTACSGTNPINVHHKQFLKSFQIKTNQSSPQTVPETKLFRKKTNRCSPQTDFEIVTEQNQSMFTTTSP
jgi:hypothetical protein